MKAGVAMSRRDAHLDAMLRHLGAAYYQTLRGEGSAAEVARGALSRWRMRAGLATSLAMPCTITRRICRNMASRR